MLGLGMVFGGLAAVGNGEAFGAFVGLAGIYLLFRQFEQSSNNRDAERRADIEYERWRRRREQVDYAFADVDDEADRRPNTPHVYSHALQAAQSAGLDPSAAAVLPVDVGVIAYRGQKEQKIYRMRGVPNDVDYIRPFVELRLPRAATGKVTFELLDDRGEVVFLHEERHQFNKGRNLIIPSRWVPVHDALDMDEGGWTLKVNADGLPVAVHTFDWRDKGEAFAAEQLADDGEISNELRAAMAESRLENISLDELLSFQGEDDPPPAQRQAKR